MGAQTLHKWMLCAGMVASVAATSALAAPAHRSKPPPAQAAQPEVPLDIEGGGPAGPNASTITTARRGSLASLAFAGTILTVSGPSVEVLGDSSNGTHH